MKITRKQLRKLLRETSSEDNASSKLVSLIKSGNPEHIVQSKVLADTIGIDFESLVKQMIESINFFETIEADNTLSEIENVLLLLRQNALASSLNLSNDSIESVLNEDEIADIEMELVFSIKNQAIAALERSLVQTIVSTANNNLPGY